MAKKIKKEYAVGDSINTVLVRLSGEKVKVKGKVKKVRSYFGRKTYIVTEGIVEDFPTRTIK